jgi:UDP:flavonoid glycosyltransferase YjiC (YdhE family)
MADFLLPSTPIYGHVRPMLTIGAELRRRGHGVTVLTGSKYQEAVRLAGLDFLPLPPAADYDDADLSGWLPDRDRYRGVAAGRYDVIGLFIQPLEAQHQALTAALREGTFDAVICETGYLGALPELYTVPAARRLPMIGISTTPLALMSADCAPFGSGLHPGRTSWSRRRNRRINTILHHGPLRPIQQALDAAVGPLGVPPGVADYFDQAGMFDVTFHLAAPGFEYPRSDMPPSIRLVGPLRPERGTIPRPDWWADLGGPEPVVHVTQGTMDNIALDKLLLPTIRGLADEPVLVVASTGGRPLTEVAAAYGPLPSNVRVATFLPYDQLLPLTDVVVTNGGFGGVQQALAHGLPLVVAGATEDKPEVAARVAWSRTGVNLRRGTPSPARVRSGVRAVLADPRYRRAAQGLQQQIQDLGDPLVEIVAAAEMAAAGRGASEVGRESQPYAATPSMRSTVVNV